MKAPKWQDRLEQQRKAKAINEVAYLTKIPTHVVEKEWKEEERKREASAPKYLTTYQYRRSAQMSSFDMTRAAEIIDDIVERTWESMKKAGW